MEPQQQTGSYSSFLASPESSYKHTSYFQVYDDLLKKYAGTDLTFVEVGVFNGGSLFMWRDFFGPKARIIGIDMNPGARKWQDHGFEIFIGSQSDPSFWSAFFKAVGPIDVFLDDGGHFFDQQIVTFECAIDSIKDGGLLLVEDTHTSFMNSFYGPSRLSFQSYAKMVADRINARHGPTRIPASMQSRAVYSVEFFESIVAFKIDRRKCIDGSPVFNRPPKESALDFAQTDRSIRANPAISTIRYLLRKISRLFRDLPILGPLVGQTLNDLANLDLLKYFVKR
jgi:hypothetical protein